MKMIKMEAVIENTPFGDWAWFAHLRDEPAAGGNRNERSVRIGKLRGPKNGTLLTCRRAIFRVAERLGARVVRINKQVRRYEHGQLDGNIIEDLTIWQQKD